MSMKRPLWIVLALLALLLVGTMTVSAKDKDKNKDKNKNKDKEKVTICHKPGTAAQKTMQVAQSALDGHLAHGDYEGECTEEPAEPTATPSVTATAKITICHKPGTPAQHTLVVAAPALDGHLGHGDYEGECTDEPPEPAPTPTDTVKILICHKPGTPAEKTLEIDTEGLEDHLGHGDYLGECTEETPEPDQVWTTPSHRRYNTPYPMPL
jgi:hypothetical protein